MRELGIDEVKKIEYGILDNVAAFCDEHGIRYSLCYGTMLGAYRHNGFIPWDDDVDIMMPREDYIKFFNTFSDKSGRYKAMSPYEKRSIFRFGKVYDSCTVKHEEGVEDRGEIGVDIDVFPVDNFPNSRIINFFDYHIRFCLGRFFGISIRIIDRGGGLGSAAANALRRIIKSVGSGRWLKILEFFAVKYNKRAKKFAGVRVTTNDGYRDRIPSELFEEYDELEFEGKMFKVVSHPERYLEIMYGKNYMTPPPEGERGTHHINKMYLKEENDYAEGKN